jgi:hypothetical protein
MSTGVESTRTLLPVQLFLTCPSLRHTTRDKQDGTTLYFTAQQLPRTDSRGAKTSHCPTDRLTNDYQSRNHTTHYNLLGPHCNDATTIAITTTTNMTTTTTKSHPTTTTTTSSTSAEPDAEPLTEQDRMRAEQMRMQAEDRDYYGRDLEDRIFLAQVLKRRRLSPLRRHTTGGNSGSGPPPAGAHLVHHEDPEAWFMTTATITTFWLATTTTLRDLYAKTILTCWPTRHRCYHDDDVTEPQHGNGNVTTSNSDTTLTTPRRHDNNDYDAGKTALHQDDTNSTTTLTPQRHGIQRGTSTTPRLYEQHYAYNPYAPLHRLPPLARARRCLSLLGITASVALPWPVAPLERLHVDIINKDGNRVRRGIIRPYRDLINLSAAVSICCEPECLARFSHTKP